MFKKCLTVFLATLLTATAVPAFALTSSAADSTGEGEGNGAAAIAAAFDDSHLVVTNDLADDGKLGIPVTVKTYADKTLYEELGASANTAMPTTSDGRKYEVIVYVIGHNEARIGQESDVSILTDYLGQGYIAVVLDYKYHELAIASQLEYSIQNIRKKIQSSGTYLGVLAEKRPAIKKDCNFALPAGYRLARNVVYYNLLDNGIAGTAEQIVKAWNDASTSQYTFKNAKGSKVPACEYNNDEGGWYEATSVEQLVRPDPVTGEARPLDFNLYMDIIYPSDPTRETPVYMLSSSHEQREGESVGNGGPLHTGLLLRGFTTVAYDHEYFPMARDDHYGYFIGTYGYGMARQIGVKTHTAAVRCARYYAAEYGYSEADGYSVGGGSKASYCAILGSDEPNDRAELASFEGDSFNTTDYTTAGQPWLTYSAKSEMAGEKISARVQGVVTFMGDGTNLHAQIVNKDTSPTVIACGIYDQFGAWEKWPACQETYMKYDVPHLAMSMYDRGHAWPAEVDSVLKYDRSQAMIEFLYYWANNENVAPRVIYTSPYNGDDGNKNEEPIVIHFAGDIPLDEVTSKVKIVDVTANTSLTGKWTASAGNNKFEFTANEDFVNGHTYEIVIPNTLADSRGTCLEETVTTTFVSAADVKLTPVKDAYIVSGSATNTGSEAVIKLSGSTSRGYLEFDVSSIKADSILTRLVLNAENDATNTILVYALDEDAAEWSENTLVWNNAPAASTLVGSIGVAGAGQYTLDVTQYVAALEGNTARLVLVNKLNSAEAVYDESFDSLTSFVKGTDANPVGSYSSVYDYRQGGAPASLGLSSEEDHTTGSGKSFKVVRNNDYDRFKFYNTIKSSALTEDDIGTTYRATFWVKTDASISVTAGLMMPAGTYGQKFCGTTSTTDVPADTWTQCELVYTLTEENVTNQAAMLTVQGTGTSTLYVDDIHVEIVATDVTLTSREGASAPTLYANVNHGAAMIDGVQYETFADALAAVPTDGTATTVQLLEDVALTAGFTVAAGMNLTVDLGGHTVSAVNLSKMSGSTAPIAVRGSLTLTNGTLDVSTTETSGYYAIHVYGPDSSTKATLELADGLTLKAVVATGAIQVGNGTYFGDLISHDGVTVSTSRYFVYAYKGCSVTVFGGTYEDTVETKLFYLLGEAESVIYGGTFTSVVGSAQGGKLFNGTAGLVLKGGTYNEKPSDSLIADGYEVVDRGDGTYVVIRSRLVGEPTAFTYVSQAEPDKSFGTVEKVLLTGENGKNTVVLATFTAAELAKLEYFRIPVCGTADGKISIAVIDGWSVDGTVTYNSVQAKLWAELMTTEKAGKHVGRYTVGTRALTLAAEDVLSKVTGDVFTLVLQADEAYTFEQNFNGFSEVKISEGATQGVIGSTSSLNVCHDGTYMASRGNYNVNCAIHFASVAGKDGNTSMAFRVTYGGQRYKFYNALSADDLTVLDIGRTFHVSVDVMTTADVTSGFTVSLQCLRAGDGTTSPDAGGYSSNSRYYAQTVKTQANVWQTVEFDVTVDETIVNYQIGLLAFEFPAKGAGVYFYVDNIKVTETNGNAKATAFSFSVNAPVTFADTKAVTLSDAINVIEADVSLSALDTNDTQTALITHGEDVLLAIDNQTGELFFEKNGTAYRLCDADGNVFTLGADALPVAALLDKSAGTVRYAVDGKLAYYLDGTTAVNTYGTVAASGGFGTEITVGAAANPFGGADTANVTVTAVGTDTPRLVGTQMSTTDDAVRVLSGIDTLYYSGIGFIATRGDGTTNTWRTSTVFTSVNAYGEPVTAETLGCHYLSCFVIDGLTTAANGDTFTVTPVAYVGEQELRGAAVTYTITVNGTTVSVSERGE